MELAVYYFYRIPSRSTCTHRTERNVWNTFWSQISSYSQQLCTYATIRLHRGLPTSLVCIVIVMIQYGHTVTTYFTGLLCCLVFVIFCAAPLSMLFSVIETKSTDILPFPLILASCLVSLIWFVYGYMIDDKFIQASVAVDIDRYSFTLHFQFVICSF